MGFHWTDYHKICCLSIFRTSFLKIKFSLESEKNIWYFTWRLIHVFLNLSRQVLLRMGNVRKSLWRNSKHIICLKTFFFSKILPFLDNLKKYCRAGQATEDNKTWRMHVACLILKATGTHSEYVILLFHYKFCFTKAPQFFVIRSLSVFRVFCNLHWFQFIIC